MAKMFITKGVPGCGKSTKAKEMIANDGNLIRVNRDDIRLSIHGGLPWSGKREKVVVLMQYAMIRAALEKGVNVIVDDTNLHPGTMQKLKDLATECKAKWEIIDLTNVPIEVCIERDAKRKGRAYVGHDVIREFSSKSVLGLVLTLTVRWLIFP